MLCPGATPGGTVTKNSNILFEKFASFVIDNVVLQSFFTTHLQPFLLVEVEDYTQMLISMHRKVEQTSRRCHWFYRTADVGPDILDDCIPSWDLAQGNQSSIAFLIKSDIDQTRRRM
jgi:hypothetical protein